ncbi:MAG: methyltransferase domain-containing protein [Pseudomonadales bacterium]|nr:methyltransferase domain-containing protein [Pseudomonadales bacterium]
MSNFYEAHILPRIIDKACGQPPMTKLRARYLAQAEGRVLEIGIGSGLNLPHYPQAVESITGVDPVEALTVKAASRAENIQAHVDVIGVSGEEIPVSSESFDTVVCTWTLCSIPNPEAAVSEMYRALKPGGKLIFVEHGSSDDINIQKWQRRLEPIWKVIGGGCHLTRRADELIKGGGFNLLSFESGYQPGPKFASFMMHGLASR